MANIMDLLMDYKKTIKINDNISMPYISYHVNIFPSRLTSYVYHIIFVVAMFVFFLIRGFRLFLDHVDGRYHFRTRNYFSYVGGSLRGSFSYRQLDQLLL